MTPDARAAAQAARRIAEELASVEAIARIAGQAAPRLSPSDDPLLHVAALIGEAQGFVVRPPPRARPDDRQSPIDRIARASRCRARRVELLGAWWLDGGPPLLAFVSGRAVALLPDRRGRYVLFDPAVGRREPIDAARAETIAAEAIHLVRPLPERALGLVDLLRFALVGLNGEIARAVAWGIGLTLVGMAVPVATGVLIDQAIPDADLTTVFVLGAGLLAVTVAGSVFQRAQGIALLRLDTTVSVAAQMALWDRLLRLPLAALRAYPVGDLVARARSVTAVSSQLTGVTLQALLGGLLGALNFGLLLRYSPSLAAIALGAGALTVGLTLQPALAASAAARRLVQQRGKVFGATVQMLGGVAKIQAAGVRDAALAWWWRQYVSQLELQWGLWVARSRIVLLQTVLPPATTGVLFVAAARQHAEGQLSAGTFVAFNATFALFLGGLNALASSWVDLASARAEGERASPLLAALPEVREGSIEPGELAGGVEIERLRFRYRADAPYVIEGMSLSFRPGEFVALVGGSGCGKSTLIRLLLGFEAPESGRILFDGKDLSGLDAEALRRQLGVVLQNGRIGGGSILEVVAGANLVTVDEVWHALDAAAMRAEIQAMPMGIHTLVGDGGGNLSGGQRQRLLIARAMVNKPKLLIFDEATSALDNKSQAEISANLARLSVTRIVIAHRLSTIREADRIYVLADGRVAQSGTFAELEGIDGPFRRLVARQRVG